MHAGFHKDFNIYQYWFILIYRSIFYQYIPVMHACFDKDFNIYQYQFISIYRDIFYQYIDTPNVESMTAALVHLWIETIRISKSI